MTGIEVAGLVLGALPFILKSVDTYQEGFHRIGTAFKKRKHVDKLARALRFQQFILNELMKSIISASGCEDASALEHDPFSYLNNPDVQEQVGQYLGPENTRVLIDELESSSKTVSKVARCISGLVPGFQGPEDDLVAIIKGNQDKSSLMADLAPRIKLLLKITEIKNMIQELDKGSDLLERFSRLALSNCQSTNSNSSRKSQKLAKAFRQIRGLAEGLYNAILEGFRDECHDSHEARLYLDDRIETAHQLLHRRGSAGPDKPQMMFDLVFHAGGYQGDTLYYETAVQVFDNYDIDNVNPKPGSTPEPVKATVTFCVTDDPPASKPNVATIASICTTIKEARGMNYHLTFALLENRQMGTFPDHNALPATPSLSQGNHRDYVPLSQVLKTSSTTNLSWKDRLQLSLRLASSLLQLLHTPWLTQAFRKDAVFFLVSDAPSGPSSRPKRSAPFDLNRPFIVRNFSGESPVMRPTEPKAALLELGIILMEIWHGMTLEAYLGLEESDTQSQSMKYVERLAQALEWEDDWTDSMPGVYGQTVSQCLRGNNVSAGKRRSWEDPNLWSSICGDIIEPLSKLCRDF